MVWDRKTYYQRHKKELSVKAKIWRMENPEKNREMVQRKTASMQSLFAEVASVRSRVINVQALDGDGGKPWVFEPMSAAACRDWSDLVRLGKDKKVGAKRIYDYCGHSHPSIALRAALILAEREYNAELTYAFYHYEFVARELERATLAPKTSNLHRLLNAALLKSGHIVNKWRTCSGGSGQTKDPQKDFLHNQICGREEENSETYNYDRDDDKRDFEWRMRWREADKAVAESMRKDDEYIRGGE